MAEIKSEHKLVYTNNLICDAILTRYAALCRAENIELKIHGTFPDQLYISDTDLCVLISDRRNHGLGTQNMLEAARKNGGSVTWSFNEPNLVSVEILVCCAKRNLVS